jgi:hypothetical protein
LRNALSAVHAENVICVAAIELADGAQ